MYIIYDIIIRTLLLFNPPFEAQQNSLTDWTSLHLFCVPLYKVGAGKPWFCIKSSTTLSAFGARIITYGSQTERFESNPPTDKSNITYINEMSGYGETINMTFDSPSNNKVTPENPELQPMQQLVHASKGLARYPGSLLQFTAHLSRVGMGWSLCRQ